MNFNRDGWFLRYLDFRTTHPFPVELPSAGVKVVENAGVHHELDQAIYYFLQPTGLLYGFPVGLPFPQEIYPDSRYLDTAGRMSLTFLESLFACLVADRHYLLEGLSDEEEHFMPAVKLAASYFLDSPNGRAINRWRALQPLRILQLRNPTYRFESAIRSRLGQPQDFFKLPGNYYNSFLFLDLYYCMLWQRRMLVEPADAQRHLGELGEQQLALRELMLRMIIAAALANGQVETMERRVIDWFFKSSGLPLAIQKTVRQEMDSGLALERLEPPEMPWLMRRFILETMLMILLGEGRIDYPGLRFMERVVEKLGLWNEELNQSITALEVFILNQRDQLQVLSRRPAFLQVGENLRERATLAARKNVSRVVNEIRETQELYTLMMKATQTPLTAEEKGKVRAQLMDIMKTIPALAIFALPGGGLILPILIRLLPFNLLPSSFED